MGRCRERDRDGRPRTRRSDLRGHPLEAAARRRAAEALFAAGRRAEGEAMLEPALAFWRSVGATAYLHEGEALLAAAS
jgi:hypothetical protein